MNINLLSQTNRAFSHFFNLTTWRGKTIYLLAACALTYALFKIATSYLKTSLKDAPRHEQFVDLLKKNLAYLKIEKLNLPKHYINLVDMEDSEPIDVYLASFLQLNVIHDEKDPSSTKKILDLSTCEEFQNRGLGTIRALKDLKLFDFLDCYTPPLADNETGKNLKTRMEQIAKGIANLKKVLEELNPDSGPDLSFLARGAQIIEDSLEEGKSSLEKAKQIVQQGRELHYLAHILLLRNYLSKKGNEQPALSQPSSNENPLNIFNTQECDLNRPVNDYLSSLVAGMSVQKALETSPDGLKERKILTVKDLNSLNITPQNLSLKKIEANEQNAKGFYLVDGKEEAPRPTQNALRQNGTALLDLIGEHLAFISKIPSNAKKTQKSLNQIVQDFQELKSKFKDFIKSLDSFIRNELSNKIEKFGTLKEDFFKIEKRYQIALLRCYIFQPNILMWARKFTSFSSLSDYASRFKTEPLDFFNLAEEISKHETFADFFEKSLAQLDLEKQDIFRFHLDLINWEDQTDIETYLDCFLQLTTHENPLRQEQNPPPKNSTKHVFDLSNLKSFEQKKLITLADLKALGLFKFLDCYTPPLTPHTTGEKQKEQMDQIAKGIENLRRVIKDLEFTSDPKLNILTQGANIIESSLKEEKFSQEKADQVAEDGRKLCYLAHIILLKLYLSQQMLDRSLRGTVITSLSTLVDKKNIAFHQLYNLASTI